jgi:hypothetical protein
VNAGLPKPQTQIEYDGSQHWTDAKQRSWDIDRIALLELRAAGCPI